MVLVRRTAGPSTTDLNAPPDEPSGARVKWPVRRRAQLSVAVRRTHSAVPAARDG